MLKTYRRARFLIDDPTVELFHIRRLETFLRWIGAGLLVGAVAGTLFGTVLVVVSEGTNAFWFGAMMGSSFGIMVGLPFGVVLGIFNAALPSPRPINHLIAWARAAGTTLVMTAGLLISLVSEDIFVVAAAVGAGVGWMFTPTVVWASVVPQVAPYVETGT